VNIHEYEVGLKKHELDTPSLLVDLDVVEKNIQKMAEYCKARGINLRPHAKIYKAAPVFAWKQIQAGAVGITVAKLSEAEVLAGGGIKDILIANQVVGDTTVGVLVEVNIGNNRCGVEPEGMTLEFVRQILGLKGIKFRGLMGYDGHLAFHEDQDERFRLSTECYRRLVATRDVLLNAGIDVEIVTGGGTNTYRSAGQVKGLTELQLGTYIFNDTTYFDAGLQEFGCALSVLCTVISRPQRPGAENEAILDIGRKGISTIYGFPRVKSLQGEIYSMPQEHSRLRILDPQVNLKVGDQVELWVGDANGTVNFYDSLYAMRGDRVEGVWDLPGRGKIT